MIADTGQPTLPPPQDNSHSAQRIAAVAPLLVLLAVLVPYWLSAGTEYIPDVHGQMFSPWLLPAMGLLLSSLAGKPDLSVWAGFALGSQLAAYGLWHGGPAVAVALALLAGVGLGLANTVLVAILRLPGWPASLAMAAVLAIGANRLGIPVIAPRASADQCCFLALPVLTQPITITGLIYIATMLLLLKTARRPPGQAGSAAARRQVACALVGSAVLACLGGLAWVAYSGQAVRSVPVIGDLRVAAAAVLAGGLILKDAYRFLLAGLLLPTALLAATIWANAVWDVPALAWHPSLLAVMGLAILAQALLRRCLAQNRQRVASMSALAALALASATAYDVAMQTRHALNLTTAVLFFCASLALLISLLGRALGRRGRPAAQGEGAGK